MSLRLKAISMLAVGFIWLTSACATMRVNSYAERGTDVRHFRTYIWGPADTGSTGDLRLDDPLFR